ncbi:MAG: radical SAM protein [Planctomycetota bacterium]
MRLRVALVDLEEDRHGCNNKDQTGTYGSVMDSDGLAGRVFNFLKKRLVRLPVLSFAYVAAILRRRGHEVTIHSALPEHADIVLIATSIIGYEQEIAFAREVKRHLGCTVGFTGAFAGARPELFLEGGDFVIDGEPDAWALALDDTATHSGVIQVEPVCDLDALPFPDWNGFPIQKYGYRPLLKRRPFLPMQTSRGCPFACPYCQYLPIQGTRWRSRNPTNVLDEIEYLIRDFGVRSILFRDIVFSLDMKRAKRIAEGMLNRGLRVAWGCETRVDCLSRELVGLMRRAGLRFINLGIETPDAETLERHGRKPLEQTHLEDIVRFAEGEGVLVNAFYLMGFPEDTEERVRRTIDYACCLDTSLAQFGVVTPYPGTPFHDEVRAAGRLLGRDWREYTTYNPVMKLDHLASGDILRLKREAYNRFFLRPRWMLRRGLGLLT